MNVSASFSACFSFSMFKEVEREGGAWREGISLLV